MIPAIIKKSYRDISRKKTRTILTIITIALGIMGIGLFAVSPLADRTVNDQMEKENMHNIGIILMPVNLTDEQIGDLEEIENVDKVEASLKISVKMYIGERRSIAILNGIRDFNDQNVDKVILKSGSYPSGQEVLMDSINSANGVFDASSGTTFDVIDHNDERVEVKITGEGQSILALEDSMSGFAVFYMDVESVRSITNKSGYTHLGFTLHNTDQESMENTTEKIREYLTTNTSVVAFRTLPDFKVEGEWAGQEDLDNFQTFLGIITILILICSVFLISNTMNTMISEQKKEIAQMKAIGATRSQVFRSFLTTSFLIGLIGSVIGAILGIFIAYLVLITMMEGFAFHPEFTLHLPTSFFSIFIGIGIVILASLPALFRSSKISVLEGLQTTGISAGYGKGFVDKVLMHTKFKPRTIGMGIRNANRKKGRSISTILQIALAVAVILAMLSVGNSVYNTVDTNWKDQQWDLKVHVWQNQENWTTIVEDGESILTGIEGVESAEPILNTWGDMKGRELEIYGYIQDTKALNYDTTLIDNGEGRWWTQDEENNSENVIVLGYAASKFEGVSLNDEVEVMTATGLFKFKVIGIDKSNWDDGQNIKMPITTLRKVLRDDQALSGFFVNTESKDHFQIDRTAENIYNEMKSRGYGSGIDVNYVLKEADMQENELLMSIFTILSGIVVIISLIGLMNTLTLNILDRTKEIGMLRCIGAISRDIRVIFSSEGMLLSLIAWVIGLPLGYLLNLYLIHTVNDVMNVNLVSTFPGQFIIMSFFITIIGTILIIMIPLFRATGFKPGDALRYE